MGKRQRTRRKRGMLVGLRYGSTRKRKGPPPSLPRRIAGWIGGGLLLAVMLAVVVLLFWRMMTPDFGLQEVEQDFSPVSLEDHVLERPGNAGFDVGREPVVDAKVVIRDRTIYFPLDADQLARVRDGVQIRARYKAYPSGQTIQVTVGDWWLADDPPPE